MLSSFSKVMHQEARGIKHRCLKLMESPGYSLGLLCLPRVGHQFVKGELLGSCMDWELHWHVSHWIGRCSQWIILTNIHCIEGMQSMVNATVHRMGNQALTQTWASECQAHVAKHAISFLIRKNATHFHIVLPFQKRLGKFSHYVVHNIL